MIRVVEREEEEKEEDRTGAKLAQKSVPKVKKSSLNVFNNIIRRLDVVLLQSNASIKYRKDSKTLSQTTKRCFICT